MQRPIVPIAGVVLMVLGAPCARAGSPLRVEFRDDRLTVHAEDTPVPAILEELKRKSGAEIRGEAPPETSVSVELDAVPLREGLERLLGDRSFTLTYGDDGRLKSIELKGGPQAASHKPEEKPTPPGKSRKDLWDPVGRVLNHRPPVHVSGRLAHALGGAEEASWEMLLGAASRDVDPIVRRQAWRAGIRAVEADAEMRNAFIAAVGALDDVELTAFARALAGMTPDAPEDLAKQFVRDCQIPELRSRARSVLRRLRLEATTASR